MPYSPKQGMQDPLLVLGVSLCEVLLIEVVRPEILIKACL